MRDYGKSSSSASAGRRFVLNAAVNIMGDSFSIAIKDLMNNSLNGLKEKISGSVGCANHI